MDKNLKEGCEKTDVVSQMERKEAGLDKTNPEHVNSNKTNDQEEKENDNKQQDDQSISLLLLQHLQYLPKFVEGCFHDSKYVQIESCSRIRKLLSIRKNAPIDQVIKTGVVPRLIEFLGYENNPRLQFDAAYSLADIAAGESTHTAVVVKHGAIPHLIQLLLSSNKDVAEGAVFALGNIAGDSTQYRDIILSQGGLTNLRVFQNHCFDVLNSTANKNGWRFEQLLKDEYMLRIIELLSNIGWTLTNFFLGSEQTQTDIKYAQSGIEALTVMFTVPDGEILEHAVRGVDFLTSRDKDDNNDNMKNDHDINTIDTNGDGEKGNVLIDGDGDEHAKRDGDVSIKKRERERERQRQGDGKETENEKDGKIRSYNDKINFMKESGTLSRLIQCLQYGNNRKSHRGYRIQLAALRALRNTTCSDDKITQYLVDLGICYSLVPLLDLHEYENEIKKKYKYKLLKQTCWVISNITAGTVEQIDKVIKANLFSLLINLLDKATFDIRKEALCAICNATRGSQNQIRYLVYRGVIHPMINLLECNNSEVLLVAMDGLNNILKCGEDIKNADLENNQIKDNEFACYVKTARCLNTVK